MAIVFKDLQKLVSAQQQENTRKELFDICKGKPFWVWFDTILKHTYEILQASQDNREKLQAMQMYRDTHQLKLDLLSNPTTIDSALNYIRTKQQQQKKAQDLGSTVDGNNDQLNE